jgi:16S rRNA (guanine527-N7)-methyltransferase
VKKFRAPLAKGNEAVSDLADRAKAQTLVPVSRETEERLAVFVDLLRRWQTIKNLVGPSTLQAIWTRHIADSAQLVDLMPKAKRWVDLGSGAGFPGIVIAIMLQGQDGVRIDLVESNERKCAFLREAIRVTGAPARVHMGRIEKIVPLLDGTVDVATSRALAALPELVSMSQTLLDRGAVGLFLKGEEAVLSEAAGASFSDGGDYDYDMFRSRTHPNAQIIRVRKRMMPL